MQPKLDQHEGLSPTQQEPRGAEEDASKGSGPQAVHQFVQLIPASNLNETHRKERKRKVRHLCFTHAEPCPSSKVGENRDFRSCVRIGKKEIRAPRRYKLSRES